MESSNARLFFSFRSVYYSKDNEAHSSVWRRLGKLKLRAVSSPETAAKNPCTRTSEKPAYIDYISGKQVEQFWWLTGYCCSGKVINYVTHGSLRTSWVYPPGVISLWLPGKFWTIIAWSLLSVIMIKTHKSGFIPLQLNHGSSHPEVTPFRLGYTVYMQMLACCNQSRLCVKIIVWYYSVFASAARWLPVIFLLSYTQIFSHLSFSPRGYNFLATQNFDWQVDGKSHTRWRGVYKLQVMSDTLGRSSPRRRGWSPWEQTIPGIERFRNFKQMEHNGYESHETAKTSWHFGCTVFILNVALFFFCLFFLMCIHADCSSVVLKHGNLHFSADPSLLKLSYDQGRVLFSAHPLVAIMSLSEPHKSPQSAHANKGKEHPVVQWEEWRGVVVPWLPQQQCWIISKAASIYFCEPERDELTKLAWQHLCKPTGSVTERISAFAAKVIAGDREQISFADNATWCKWFPLCIICFSHFRVMQSEYLSLFWD